MLRPDSSSVECERGPVEATSAVIGIEALIRWQHPERGLLYPHQFIGLAEDSGLIVPIGKWVLRTACDQNLAWQASGFAAIPIAVNLSAMQLRRRDFLEDVTGILRESGLAPQHLNFELTESVLMYGADTTVSLLLSLRRMGVQLSIEDFGTDYSSLSYLKRFPVDALKIDRTFINDITTDSDDAAITRATISMGHSLRLRVIAEGVETREQLEFLQALRCDEGQGTPSAGPRPRLRSSSCCATAVQPDLPLSRFVDEGQDASHCLICAYTSGLWSRSKWPMP